MNIIDNLLARYKNNIKFYIGYPQNINFDYRSLYSALSYPINNYGDPFLLQNPISSHEYELEVIRWFLDLFGLNDKNGWGYVTSGSTEGILFGVWQGREYLKKPILYCSDYAHYAVLKAAKLTNLEYKLIKTSLKGEMDYEDFDNKLVKERDALVVATLGTTMTSAIDNVSIIRDITAQHKINTFIHADAAFDGMLLPFITTNHAYQLTQGIDSISVSGHKVIGSPLPCGVILIHNKHVEHIRRTSVDYINNKDCTITGSRPGFTALVLWQAISQKKYTGFKSFANECLQRAEMYTTILNQHHIDAWRFESAITIVLDKLPKKITKKWRVPSNNRYTTLTALPKLSDDLLHNFIHDVQYFRENGELFASDEGIMFPRLIKEISLKED